MAEIGAGRFRFLNRLNDLRLEIDQLQANPDQVDFSDIALLESDGIDLKNTREAVPVFFRQHQTSPGQLRPVVRILHGKPQLANGIFKAGLCRLKSKFGTLDPIPSFAGQFEQLLNLRRELSAVPQRAPLNRRAHNS